MTGLPAFCEVFFDSVKVPKEDLLGAKNGGLKILMYAFGAERSSGLFALHNSRRYLEQLIDYCKNTVVDGQPLSQDPEVRIKLGQLAIETQVGIGLGERLNWMASKGMDTVKASNQMKVFGARTVQHVAQTGQEILGLYGQLNENSKWVRLGEGSDMPISAPWRPAFLVARPRWPGITLPGNSVSDCRMPRRERLIRMRL